MSIISTINGLKPEIIQKVSAELDKLKGKLDDYEIAWKQLQDISAKVIIEILTEKLPDTCTLSSPTSKSTYPDIKIETPEGNYAIDIKGNESSKNIRGPLFSRGRFLDEQTQLFFLSVLVGQLPDSPDTTEGPSNGQDFYSYRFVCFCFFRDC